MKRRDLLEIKTSYKLTVNVALLAFILRSEAVTRESWKVVNTSRSNKAQIFSGIAFVVAPFNDILMLRSYQGCDGKQVRSGLSALQNDVSDTADEWLDDVLHTVKLFFGT